jgi:hypothetical protein
MSRGQMIVVGSCLLFTSVATLFALLPREPRYDGESLSYWLDRNTLFSTNRNEETSKAIRAFGTNAVPYLKKRLSLSSRDSKLKIQISHAVYRLTKRNLIKANEDLKQEALMALTINRGVSQSLIYELGGCLTDHNPMIRMLALGAIRNLGEQASPLLPGLVRLLDSSDQGEVLTALNVIHVLVPVAQEAIPKVQALCHSENPQISGLAKSVHDRFRRKGLLGEEQWDDPWSQQTGKIQ